MPKPAEPRASSAGSPKLARAGGASAAPIASVAMARTRARSMRRQRTRGRPGCAARPATGREDAPMRVIALEEHFWTPAVAEAIGALRNPDTTTSQSPLAANLEDLGEGRLAAMDAA